MYELIFLRTQQHILLGSVFQQELPLIVKEFTASFLQAEKQVLKASSSLLIIKGEREYRYGSMLSSILIV
jgi:hypothetical protein